MTPNWNDPVVRVGEIEISTEDVLTSLHRRGQLLPLLRGVAVETMIEANARAAGLTVSDQELQEAANRHRQLLGLRSAERTHAWLAAERLTMDEFERSIEFDVLIEKFRHYLLARYGEEHFRNNPGPWTPVKLRRMILTSLSEARELLVQIREEGGSFPELAGRNSLDVHDRQTKGDLGILLRSQLQAEVGDAVFLVSEGQVAGPVHGPLGYELYLVEEFPPVRYDQQTQAAIQEELFRTFVASQVGDIKFSGPVSFSSPVEPSDNNAEPGPPVQTSIVFSR